MDAYNDFPSHITHCSECALKWVQMKHCIEGNSMFNMVSMQLPPSPPPRYTKAPPKIRTRLNASSSTIFTKRDHSIELLSPSTMYMPEVLNTTSASSSPSSSSSSVEKKEEVVVVPVVECNICYSRDHTSELCTKGKCVKCNQRGHSPNQCRVNLTLQCDYCNVKGHMTSKCRDYPPMLPSLLNKK